MVRHQLVPYSAMDELAFLIGPFLRAGLDQGDHVVAATSDSVRRAVAETLGGDAEAVDFVDTQDWYRGLALATGPRPANGNGRALRLLGEPPSGYVADTRLREWMRCEAATNLALPRISGRFACLYDVSRLSDEAIENTLRTHPYVLGAEGTQPSLRYIEPRAFAAHCDRDPLAPLGAAAEEEWFDRSSLSAARHLALRWGQHVGLGEDQLYDLGLGVTELATNAICHGGGEGVLRIWTEDGALVCEVSDNGRGMTDSLAGYLRPRPGTATGGWGLWLTRRVSDLVELRTGPHGTTVRLRMLVQPLRTGTESGGDLPSGVDDERREP